jgi:hypothetical protein
VALTLGLLVGSVDSSKVEDATKSFQEWLPVGLAGVEVKEAMALLLSGNGVGVGRDGNKNGNLCSF